MNNSTKNIIVDIFTSDIFNQTIKNIMLLHEISKPCTCDKRDCGCGIIDVDGKHITSEKAIKFLEKIKERINNL